MQAVSYTHLDVYKRQGPDWCGEKKRPEEERYRLVAGEHKKFLDATQANLYAMRHAQGIWEGQRASCPDRRVVNLTRSGCAGSQRYGTILWSGDISASWDTMRKQLAEGLNLCMSGLPYWTLDAGGFVTVKDDYTKRGCGSSGNPNPVSYTHLDVYKRQVLYRIALVSHR